MKAARDYERLLDTARYHLERVLGIGKDRRAQSSYCRAHENLAVWADTGHPSQSQLVGTRSASQPDLSARVIARLDHPDEFTAARRELTRLTVLLAVNASRLAKIVDAATTTKPSARDETSRAECRLCAAVGASNAVYARGLCDWCWRLSQKLGRDADGRPIDPHVEIVREYNLRGRVSLNMIAQYHPIPTAGYELAR